MFSDYSESESVRNKKYPNIDSENSHFNSDLNGNDEEFKEFLDYIMISIEKNENKLKEVYENIKNSYDNIENLGKNKFNN